MVRRCALVLLVVALGTAAVGGRALAQAPTVVVTPTGGSVSDTFVVQAFGFPPGAKLAQYYISPDGGHFELTFNGVQSVVIVGTDGTASVTVTPAIDFENAGPGDWFVKFCGLEPFGCWGANVAVHP